MKFQRVYHIEYTQWDQRIIINFLLPWIFCIPDQTDWSFWKPHKIEDKDQKGFLSVGCWVMFAVIPNGCDEIKTFEM